MSPRYKHQRRGPIWARRKQDPAVAAELDRLGTDIEGRVERIRAFADLRSLDTAVAELRRRDLNAVRKGQVAAELVAAYRAGSQAAAEALLIAYGPLLAQVAGHFSSCGLPKDELEHLARSAFAEAIASSPGALSPRLVGKTFLNATFNGVRRAARRETYFRRRHEQLEDALRAMCPDAPADLSESLALELLQRCNSTAADPVQTHFAATLLAELTGEEQDLLVAVKLLGESLASYAAKTHPELSASQRATLVKRLSEQLDSILERIRASASDDGFDD